MLQNFGQTRTLPQKFGVFKKFQEFLNFYGVLWQILLEFGKYSIFQSYLEFYFKYSWWNFFLEYCISKLRNSDQVTGPLEENFRVWDDDEKFHVCFSQALLFDFKRMSYTKKMPGLPSFAHCFENKILLF